ncbi:hypothetical protein MUG84_06140 [Paenibacillus sp. KQZ6P-2]|uniref:Uncharacterized protein n=1 Tax=Paenibacillus mangrovi TaxID=2931978 RepID=A0A9X2B4S8_9BACL|nr:hypothetical protein [Paenibacillus mangrovi]MCJ8011328.1 hypothetical protein [Paenibacillus mangrovi]
MSEVVGSVGYGYGGVFNLYLLHKNNTNYEEIRFWGKQKEPSLSVMIHG